MRQEIRGGNSHQERVPDSAVKPLGHQANGWEAKIIGNQRKIVSGLWALSLPSLTPCLGFPAAPENIS